MGLSRTVPSTLWTNSCVIWLLFPRAFLLGPALNIVYHTSRVQNHDVCRLSHLPCSTVLQLCRTKDLGPAIPKSGRTWVGNQNPFAESAIWRNYNMETYDKAHTLTTNPSRPPHEHTSSNLVKKIFDSHDRNCSWTSTVVFFIGRQCKCSYPLSVLWHLSFRSCYLSHLHVFPRVSCSVEASLNPHMITFA